VSYRRYGEPRNQRSLWVDKTGLGVPLGRVQARDIICRRLDQLTGHTVLSETEIRRLTHSLSSRRYTAGDIILRKGIRGDFLAVVTEGQVAVESFATDRHPPSEGGDSLAMLLLPGRTFGEAMLLDGRPSDSTVRAVTNAEIYVLRRADFLSIVGQHSSQPGSRHSVSVRLVKPGPTLSKLVTVGGRLLSVAVLVIALIFFVALLMELGRRGDLRMLPSAAPAAGESTVQYLRDLAHGDLGTVASRFGRTEGTPVVTELARALPKSLGLLSVSLMIAVLAGLYLAISAALRRHSRLSGLLLFSSALGVSTPSYLAAMLLIWLAVWLYRTTGQQALPIAGFGWDAHLLLPALVLAARPAAAVTRLGYNALVEILEADHVRTARSKGLKENVVLLEHVLRNAGVPILTTIVVSLRFSLAILPIVEYIFSWPGIGQALLSAIQAGDTDAAIGMILPLALLFVLVNLIAESLYLRLDPRLRDSKVGVA
jgi:ABC-type dipeptide/oligopeptide/nickel transport system permease component